jgi:hypothetical protein
MPFGKRPTVVVVVDKRSPESLRLRGPKLIRVVDRRPKTTEGRANTSANKSHLTRTNEPL